MKHTLLFFLLLFNIIATGQTINIPDVNFKNALLASGITNDAAKDAGGNTIIVDVNTDGEIQQSEALPVFEIRVVNMGISSLEGIEHFSNLAYLDCAQNLITQLDLSNTNVNKLNISNNNIHLLNIKNGIIEDNTTEPDDNWSGNPLVYVCADENELDVITDILILNNYTNVNVNTYCSLTPGGDYNTISGVFTFDTNNNGCTSGDAQQFVKVNLNNSTETISTFTNVSGEYAFYTSNGEFTIEPEFENDYFTISPVSATVNFPVVDNTTETENFCVSANGTFNDIEVIMVPVIPARPGEEAVYKIVYRNKGNQVLSGTIDCQWDSSLFSNMSLLPPPDVQSSGYYAWNYFNLRPFEVREVMMTLTVNTPTSVPPVNNGDILSFIATATQTGEDAMPEDNNFILGQEVVNSFNANNIICIEGETVSPDTIGEYLHYVINFQNTGNATANSVVVVANINSADFDINTLQMINTSHDVDIKVLGNSIEFFFKNINMAAADHGNILFKLKTRPSLTAGDNVMSSGNVYFDYNMPVTTNEATTVFGSLNTGDFVIDASVKVYPNPTPAMVAITASSNINSYELYDIQGRLLQSAIVNDTAAKLDISQRAAGIYFIKIYTGKGVMIEKIIKK